MVVIASLHDTQHKKKLCEQQAGELACCVLGQGTQRDASISMWWTGGVFCISPGYNCEAVHPASCKSRILGTQQRIAGFVDDGLLINHDWYQMG